MKNILELSNEEAKAFFLRSENYCNINFPKYFNFQPLLDSLSQSKHIANISLPKAKLIEDVNYKFFHNKDGKYAWRQFQLINPVLYVKLVDLICEQSNWEILRQRFSLFQQNDRIRCCSIPVVNKQDQKSKEGNILNWWNEVEQKSIELALDYSTMLNTDITDCYGSLYTHAISWAIHDRGICKSNRGQKNNILLGDQIDERIRQMSFGQTNGIPQGSVLMDFIAEIVLGYIDMNLNQRIDAYNLSNPNAQILDYYIIRYRDDYRIFANSDEVAVKIAKMLTEELLIVNFRLNSQKTFLTTNIVKDSIKPDKYSWKDYKCTESNLQRRLLQIHSLSYSYPNSGTLERALSELYSELYPLKVLWLKNVKVLVSILADIAYNNPRVYHIISPLIGKILQLETDIDVKTETYRSLRKKISRLPNTGYMEIWMQRVTLKINQSEEYEEVLCKKVIDDSTEIWNMTWIKNIHILKIIKDNKIVDNNVISQMSELPTPNEVCIISNYK